jgi:hypothetical protein
MKTSGLILINEIAISGMDKVAQKKAVSYLGSRVKGSNEQNVE